MFGLKTYVRLRSELQRHRRLTGQWKDRSRTKSASRRAGTCGRKISSRTFLGPFLLNFSNYRLGLSAYAGQGGCENGFRRVLNAGNQSGESGSSQALASDDESYQIS